MNQKTISREVKLEGPGLHYGIKTCLTIKPAAPNTGYKFVRVDIDGSPEIRAIAENVSDTSRGTTISQNGASVSTIEHLLAATYALGIDNVIFEINGNEVPILDGSAKYFVEAYHKAGIVEQQAELIVYDIDKTISFIDAERDIEINIFPDKSFKLNVLVDYQSDIISNQFSFLNNLKDFIGQISSCRTFVFLSELEPLLRLNLIKGGDLDNAIVIVDKDCSQDEFDRLSKLFNKTRLEVKSTGVLNNLKLQFVNEPARHKLLDLIGDLSLTGFRFNANVLARRPGHYGNTEVAKLIRQHLLNNKKTNSIYKNISFLNIDTQAVLDITAIRKYIPHQPPYLLIDRVISISEKEIIGVKNVSNYEFYSTGCFPSEPIMPSSFQLEAMQQAATILSLHNKKNYNNYTVIFDEHNLKFYHKVIPGDILIVKIECLTPESDKKIEYHAEAFVGKRLVCEADFVAQLIKIKDL